MEKINSLDFECLKILYLVLRGKGIFKFVPYPKKKLMKDLDVCYPTLQEKLNYLKERNLIEEKLNEHRRNEVIVSIKKDWKEYVTPEFAELIKRGLNKLMNSLGVRPYYEREQIINNDKL